MALVVLVVVLALVGGFIGDLLQVAAWAVLALTVAGAITAYFIYRAFDLVNHDPDTPSRAPDGRAVTPSLILLSSC